MHHYIRLHKNDSQSKHQDCTDFQISGQIIARNQQKPDRQHRSHKPVQRNGNGNRIFVPDEHPDPRIRLHQPVAGNNSRRQQNNTDNAGQRDAVFLIAHNQPHQNGNRHRNRHNKQRPRRIMHCADAGQRQTGQRQNQNKQYRKSGNRSDKRIYFPFGYRGQTFALMPHRSKNNHHVMHGSAKHAADQNPQSAGHKTKLCRQNRTDQRPCGRNCGKMMTEQNIFVCFHIIMPVGILHRRRLTICLQPQNLVGHKQPVKTICNGKNTQTHKNDRQRIHTFKTAPEPRRFENGSGGPNRTRHIQKHGQCAAKYFSHNNNLIK